MKIIKCLSLAFAMSLSVQSFATPSEFEVFNDTDQSFDMKLLGHFTEDVTPADSIGVMSWSTLVEKCTLGSSNSISTSSGMCAAELYLSPNTPEQIELGIIIINLVRGSMMLVKDNVEITGYQIIPDGFGQLFIEQVE